MERKRGGGLKRKVSLLLAVLLIVTGIPMDTVYAAADDGKEIILDENKDDVDVEAANAEDQNKEEESLIESTEEKEDGKEAVGEKNEEGGNEEPQTPVETEDGVEEYTVTVPMTDIVDITVYTDSEGTTLETTEDAENEALYAAVAKDSELYVAVEAVECKAVSMDCEDKANVTVGESTVECYKFVVTEDMNLGDYLLVEYETETVAPTTSNLVKVESDNVVDLISAAVCYIPKLDWNSNSNTNGLNTSGWNILGTNNWGFQLKSGSENLSEEQLNALDITLTYSKDGVTSSSLTMGSKNEDGKRGDYIIRTDKSDIIIDGSSDTFTGATTGVYIKLAVSYKSSLVKVKADYKGTLLSNPTLSGVVSFGSGASKVNYTDKTASGDVVYTLTGTDIDVNNQIIEVTSDGTDVEYTAEVESDGKTLKITVDSSKLTSLTAPLEISVDDLLYYDVTAETSADEDNFVKFGNVKKQTVKKGDNVTIQVTAKLTAAGEKANKEIESLSFAYGAAEPLTLNKAAEDNVFSGELTNVTSDISGVITANFVTKASIKFKADEITLTDDLVTEPVIYKATLNSDGTVKKWTEVGVNDTVYVGELLAVSLDVDYAAISAVTLNGDSIFDDDNKVTLNAGFDGYKFTAVAVNTLSVNAELDTEIITFEKGNYTVTIGGVKHDVSTNDYVYVETDSTETALNATIKPLNNHYQLATVDGTAVSTGQESSKSLTITYNGDLTDNKKTVSVETKKVNNFTVKKINDAGIDSVYLTNGTNLGDSQDDIKVLSADTEVKLYFKLAENVGKTGTDYTFYYVNVTTGEGDTAVTKNMVADLANEDNKAPGKALLYSLNLGKLTDHTTVEVRTVKRDGSKISFEGEHYTASIDTVSGLGADLPYITAVDDNTSLTVTLTADEGYRFKADSAAIKTGNKDGITITSAENTVTISNVKKANFKNGELTISASTEKTAVITIPTSADYNVVVKESYKYHTSDIVTGKDVKDTSGNNVVAKEYTVSATGKVEVVVTLSGQNDKLSSVTILADSLKGDTTAQPSNVSFSSSTGTATLRSINEDSTLTIKVEGDKSKLQGINLLKGQYKVTYNENDITNGFKENGDSVDHVLYLFKTAIADGKTADLTIKPLTGYEIASIKYNNKTVYDASKANDNQPSVDGVALDNGFKKSSVTIKLSDLKVNAQKNLQVETTPIALDADYNTNITFSFGADQYIAGNERKGIYFSPENELSYQVDGATKNIDGTYSLKKCAEYVTITVLAPSEVSATLSFKNNTTDVYPVVEENDNTFKIAAQALVTANVTNIVLDGEVETKDIAFTYNKELVTLKATGQYLEEETVLAKDADGNELTDGTVVRTYTVRQNKDLTVSAAVNGGKDAVGNFRYYAKLTSAGGYDYTDTETSFGVTASSDQNIAITAAENVENEILDSSKKTKLVAEDNGSYIISYGSYYYASVNQGARKADVSEAQLVIDGVETDVEVTANEAKFRVDQSAAGKTVVLNLKNADKTVASISFVVAKALTSLEVEGVVNGVITQTVDTKVSYAITLPTGTSINDLSVDPNNCDAYIKNEQLVLITNAETAKDKAATLELSNNKSGDILKTITVNTVAVAGVTDAVPTIKAVSSSSKALKVELGATGVANVALEAGCIAYKVTVKKQSGEDPANDIFYVEKSGDAQMETLTLFDEDVTKESIFDVTVQLVQLNTKLDDNFSEDNAKVVDQSKTITEVKGTTDFIVKVPYYTNAEELVLSNQVGTVYRGQTTVIADVSFGEKTSYVETENVVLVDSKGNIALQNEEGKAAKLFVDYNKLYVTIPSNLALGNYTVVVTAAAPANTVAATASMNIKVEEGVWQLELLNVPNTLYKVNGKVSSFTASVKFNDNASAKVKNKKVTWEIYKDVNGDVFTPITQKDALYGMVTIKNGKVTVNKDYSVSSNESKNTFYVVATSQENPTLSRSAKVVISQTAAEMGNLLLAKGKYDSDGDFVGYEVLKDQTTVSSDVVNSGNLYLIAVKQGLNKSVYTVSDLMTSSVTAKASNKGLTLTACSKEAVVYALSAKTTMKNVKVTVSAMDGSKASVQKVFSIDFTDMANLKLSVRGTVVDSGYKFAGTNEEILRVDLGYVDGNKEFHNFSGLLNAKLSIKGGKIISSDTITNTYLVKVTAAEATLTIQNKANKLDKYTYVLTNTAFTKTAAPALKADKASITANSVDAQSIVYTFKKSADYKFVKVQVDTTDVLKLKAKNNGIDIYSNLERAIGAAGDVDDTYVILPITNGAFTLNFAETLDTDKLSKAIPAGAYKLFLSYGDYDASGNFVPATKAGKVTVKAVAAKGGEYTANTNYTMSLVDTAQVTLTGVAGKNTTVKYPNGSALSTIVNGKKNNFAEFFKVEDGMLTLRSYEELENADLVSELQKLVGAVEADDLTGYVYYRVNGNATKEKVKVTVSLSKDALKSYAASTITMLAGNAVKSDVTVTADGSAVTVKAAAVTKGSFNADVDDEGQLVMTSYNKPSTGSSTASVKVVPSTSFYTTDANKNGVEVTVNVEAKDSFSPVIELSSNNVVFDDYNGVDSAYLAYVPYTNKIANSITKITVTDSKLDSDLKNLVEFDVNEENQIVATLTKSSLDSAVEDGLVTYGETKSMEVTVEYCNGLVKETYTLNVKLPSAASFEEGGKELKEIFTAIRKAVWDDPDSKNRNFAKDVDFAKAIAAKEAADAQYLKDVQTGSTTYEAMYAEAAKLYQKSAEDAVKAAVKAELVIGADVALDSVTASEYAVSYGTVPSVITVTITLKGASAVTNNTVEDASGNYVITTKVSVPDTDPISVYTKKLKEFANILLDKNLVTADNSITETAVIEAARAYVLSDAGNAYRIVSVEDTWEKTSATSEKKGEFYVELQVVDVYDSSHTGKKVAVGEDIAKLWSVTEAITVFTTNMNAFANGSLVGYAKPNASTKEGTILDIARAAASKNGNITVEFSKDTPFEYKTNEVSTSTPANSNKTTPVISGIKGKVVFTDTAMNQSLTQTVDITFDADTKGNTWKAEDIINKIETAIAVSGLLNDDSDESKENILLAAQKAIGNAPYEVKISDWTWTQPTYTTDGRVKYVVSLSKLESYAVDVSKTISMDQKIVKDDQYRTFDEAVALIKDTFLKEDISTWLDASGNINTDNVLTTIRSAVKATTRLSVAYKSVIDDYFTKYESACKFVKQDVNNDGRLTVTVVLTETVNGKTHSETITLNKKIDADGQTLSQAILAVNSITGVTKKTTYSEVLKKVKAVVRTSEFNVKIALDSENSKWKVYIAEKGESYSAIESNAISF